MRYKLVLWDFDGTLADTLACSVQVFNELAARRGFLPIEDPEAARGLTTLAFLKKHRIPLAKVPALVRDFRKAQRGRVAEVPLFPGLPQALRGMRREGLRMGVLSSNARDNILACLGTNQVEGLFEFVVGFTRLLGKAQAIRRVLKAEGVERREALYVGDEVRDVEAARKAGVDVAAVTWGFHPRQLLADHAPTHLIDRPPEMLELFR